MRPDDFDDDMEGWPEDMIPEGERAFMRGRRPYDLAAHETDDQRALSRRWLESYPHGLEEVDIWEKWPELTAEQAPEVAMSTEALMLTSFCRGMCAECGLKARPYSAQNRQIFAIEPLIRFLDRYRMGGALGKLMIYDASDPLDYPYLLQLLDYLEQNPNYREVGLLTSCPPGTEELLGHLLARRSQKLKVNLSVLPSSSERLEQSGALELAREDFSRSVDRCCGWGGERRFRPIEPKPIGRNHSEGILAAGFYCGDMMVMTPDRGLCYAEYHVASDLYPTERKLVPVGEARRAVLRNEFFSFSFGNGFLSNGPRLYTPDSSYIDLDTNELCRETALRHLVAYIHSILENLGNMRDFSNTFFEHLKEIETTLREGTFVLPTDERELRFYRNLIVKLLRSGREYLDATPKGRMYLFSSNYRPEYYDQLWKEIEKVVGEYKGVILGGGGEEIKIPPSI